MPPKKLQAPHRARIAAKLAVRFRNGETIPELAYRIGRDIPTVRRLLIEAGVTTTDGPMLGASEKVLAATAVARYRAGGTSVRAVAADLCVSKLDVHRWLIEAGGKSTGRQIRFPDQSDQLVAEYRAGATIRQLAVDTGRTYGAVRYELLAAGVTLRPRGIVRGSRPKALDPKQVKRRRAQATKARALYEDGATIEQIATRYRQPMSWAYTLLREAGTEMRRPGKKK